MTTMSASQALAATRAKLGRGEPEPEHDHKPAPGQCHAFGCPCGASVDLGSGGRGVCSWHAWAQAANWQAVTQALNEHQWLIDFIGEVMRVHSRGRLTDWIARSDAFFATDPHCQPTGEERDRFSFYLWRLREELSWRVGVRKDRPEPRVLVPTPKTKAAPRAPALLPDHDLEEAFNAA